LPVNLICCLVNFLLARPFSFIGHFFSFIHFKWRRFFICNWFDWCFILIQSDLNFSLCWHLASQTHCRLLPVNFLLARLFSFFYITFFRFFVLSCKDFFICNLFELRDILISLFISCP
jgi:hypothetical protein